ncbi:hypothetical protein P152DRAFT_441310 [Eremomyces bilateralis CBS 781.70]|uniref:Uncharacterized protein n=1 Tax=Eremomyces bilateralis CBS 781.70 TaxID=1392243 RepID=A0A6G1FVS8_9PEZI|nr:uncharacterized protein P152DRAFT_441310 [Eremomyces bilateralis CBS 781.70]KAF1809818.1 hypothetical protein P152DRAFT_441310 [Eremomyces bilateralis CBS 781.70]
MTRLNRSRHPGDVSNFDEYRQRLPDQWCPMVTIVGSVSSRNNDNSLDPAHARRFVIDTSVYNASNAAPVPYSMACFLEDSKRWAKVKIPHVGTFIALTAKVVGRTTDTNLLALRILDLAYLPKLASAGLTTTPTTPSPSKRPGRWEGRPTPSTPSKRSRLTGPVDEILTPSDSSLYDLYLPHPDGTADSQSTPTSPSTTARPEGSSNIPVLPSNLNSGSRPHRNRYPPKKLR